MASAKQRWRNDRLPERANSCSLALPKASPAYDNSRLRNPFSKGGICITLLLTRLPYGGGWLYAADLAGAALGCLGVVLVLLVVDPVSATLCFGALASGAGWIVVRDSDEVSRRRVSRNVAIAFAAAAAVHTGLYISGNDHLRVLWAKGTTQTGTLFERWNTYSRVRLWALGERSNRLGLRPHASNENRPTLPRH